MHLQPAAPAYTFGSLPAPPQRALRHHQMLRTTTPRHWWRTPLSLVVGLMLFVLTYFGVTGSAFLFKEDNPLFLLLVNLGIAGFILVTFGATAAGFGRPVGRSSSVTGRLRWGWLARCLATCAIAYLVVESVLFVLSGSTDQAVTPEPQWIALLAVSLLTTPLQCTGEEYLCRGWLPQLVGAVISNARASILLGGLISAGVFTLLHGEQNLWLSADRFLFGAAAVWLVWYTGGLEAAIAVHVVHNLVAEGFSIAYGGLSETLSTSESTFAELIFGNLSSWLALALITLVARRRRRAGRLQTVATAPAPPAATISGHPVEAPNWPAYPYPAAHPYPVPQPAVSFYAPYPVPQPAAAAYPPYPVPRPAAVAYPPYPAPQPPTM